MGIVLHHDLDLRVFGQLRIERAELHFGLEAGGSEEEEMRGTGRDLAVGVHPGIFAKPVRLDRDQALEVVAYEMDLLHVTVLHHLLDLRPLDLLRGGAALGKQQIADYDQEEEVEPGEIDPDDLGLPGVGIIGILRHLV